VEFDYMRNKLIVACIIPVALLALIVISYYRNRMVEFAPSTVPAQGTVLVGGKPRAGIRVTYHPQFDIGSVKFTPNGTTDSKGKFTLSSGKPGDGAPAGEYIVTFEFPALKPGGIEEEIDLFKGKYSSPEASKWRVKVEENSQETFQLD
jgi:hypothetical protein